jgi:hypothetical protein
VFLKRIDLYAWKLMAALILMKFILGMVAAYLYERMGSFFVIAALHGVINYYVLIYSGDFLTDVFYINVISVNMAAWVTIVAFGVFGFLWHGSRPLTNYPRRQHNRFRLTAGNDLFSVDDVVARYRILSGDCAAEPPESFAYLPIKNVRRLRGQLYLHHQTQQLLPPHYTGVRHTIDGLVKAELVTAKGSGGENQERQAVVKVLMNALEHSDSDHIVVLREQFHNFSRVTVADAGRGLKRASSPIRFPLALTVQWRRRHGRKSDRGVRLWEVASHHATLTLIKSDGEWRLIESWHPHHLLPRFLHQRPKTLRRGQYHPHRGFIVTLFFYKGDLSAVDRWKKETADWIAPLLK